jgi:uncharacterized protein (DUF488 family)
VGSSVFTIGHSNHTTERFSELLKQYGITLLVDIRSSPYSRFNPHFNRENLEATLAEAGIAYAFHGNSLGGKPDDPSCYDEGRVNYAQIREKEWFQQGIAYICWERQNHALAVMCAEEDPKECHRHNLVAQELLARGVEVIHIRGDGTSEEATKNQEQLTLF